MNRRERLAKIEQLREALPRRLNDALLDELARLETVEYAWQRRLLLRIRYARSKVRTLEMQAREIGLRIPRVPI